MHASLEVGKTGLLKVGMYGAVSTMLSSVVLTSTEKMGRSGFGRISTYLGREGNGGNGNGNGKD